MMKFRNMTHFHKTENKFKLTIQAPQVFWMPILSGFFKFTGENITYHNSRMNVGENERQFTHFTPVFENAVKTFFVDFACVVIKADNDKKKKRRTSP